eukprot:c20072_g1_i1 orf=101-2416(+)
MPLRRTPWPLLLILSLLIFFSSLISMQLCKASNSTQIDEDPECSTLLQIASQANLSTNCNCTSSTMSRIAACANASCAHMPRSAICGTGSSGGGGRTVRELHLSNMGLTGDLKWVAKFTHMKYLDVSMNNISGILPSTMWGLGELTHINLSFNKLSGSIPTFNYSKSYPLSTLDFSHNHIRGAFPQNLCNRFPNLTQLIVGSNNLTGPANLSVCQKLEALDASFNSLQGPLLEGLQAKSSLKSINLKHNLLNGSIPSLSGFPQLALFDVSFNNFSGIFGSEHSKLPLNLSSKLDVCHNNLEVGFNASFISRIGLSSFWPNKACKGCLQVMAPSPSPSASSHRRNSTGAHNRPPMLFKNKYNSIMRADVGAIAGIATGCIAGIVLITIIWCVLIRRKRRQNMKWPCHKPPGQLSLNKHVAEIGPFSFEAQSGTWVADVKDPSSVPVVIFEKPLMNLTFADLLQATGSFSRESEAGDGMGLMYVCVLLGVLEGDAKVTIEVLEDRCSMSTEEAHAAFKAMGEMKHDNLVPLLGYCIVGEQKLLIYKHVEGGSLEDVLHAMPEGAPLPDASAASPEDWRNIESWPDQDYQSCVIDIRKPSIDWETRLKISLGVARALAYLHNGCRRPVVHGAVSSSCILLDQASKEPMVASYDGGWGLQRRLEPGYVAPECQQSAPVYSSKCDVYGVGVVVLELATGRRAVGNYNASEATLVAWVRGLMKGKRAERAVDPLLPSCTHTQVLEMLKLGYLCTADSPSKRPSIQQVVGLLKDIAPH